ncbi:hypothetical protein PVOR_05613 [Paenibacillus vortex V453]|uniref:DUF817 domain-containing protein n=2 Tax=Paenibacillus TaxID=44249 RepID=A0A163JSG1_9BACL|nr:MULTISPECIES: DUF817 domain-containing protein [Paenibacillus]EFU42980.1 hypothetical protein PVOR_05613 [Paenibacillus vortex V453]KZS46772.1 hypothetical protein AWU65_12990 [Paenibacillus glucanolyticus]MDH6671606.1 uncharacterized membrane protein YoaT (DUF817 family) [Paenibacillus sp. LBL]
MDFIRKLWVFGYQQALSCIFPVIIFGALALSKIIEIPGIPRYDLILLICVLAQIGMLVSKLETWDELKVICVFHVIGLMLELYKVHMGSWSYPEEAWSKIGGVPLYSGFMYASVASYICQAWRRMNLRITGWPLPVLTVLLSAAIYANFFTHHYVWDARWLLTALLFVVFGRTVVYFDVDGKTLRMPLVLSFLLIGFFIWIAENISTFLGAWTYPGQERTWSLVHIGKISSWFLLVVISVIIVAQLKHLKLGRGPSKDNPKGTVM